MIRVIVACDRQQGISKQGYQPWYIPDDEKYFTDMTKSYGAVVLTGRTTYDLIGKPLSDRTTYVLTSDKNPVEGVVTVNNLDAALRMIGDVDVWIIGGANVYEQIFEQKLADELYITRIDADFGCTQYFPQIGADFELSSVSELHEQNGFIYTYEIYTKVSKNELLENS